MAYMKRSTIQIIRYTSTYNGVILTVNIVRERVCRSVTVHKQLTYYIRAVKVKDEGRRSVFCDEVTFPFQSKNRMLSIRTRAW